ncbi:hypothetical protein CANARDRAFT_27873 [[Candida] arabinofermentans NRRL YB-2248]|uniref:Uncharacterized protein n=1 Tax=[Candida] arabinofermentans NRRL YB-2248 TaxID=983967 RepID=A0A1E4T205_9ASCO|nr:hypothetical protein CANARDRAFT_27873 [[Candida] arabinofermentans NRRL YB-2248]
MGNIQPKFNSTHIYKSSEGAVSSSSPKHSVEFFLDYDCPFSAKLFKKLNDEIIPLLKSKGILGEFDLTIINVIQPWHHINSGVMHEVALAVANEYPSQFWKFSTVLFENIQSFYDSETFDLSRKQITQKAIDLAVANLKDIDGSALWKWLVISKNADGSPSNAGNKLAKDVKYFTRYHRTIGVHVTPTVSVDGIPNGSIESSSPAQDIVKILSDIL